MGWLRLVGSLKSQVSFAEYRLFDRALLQKRPIILPTLLTVATPYLDSPVTFESADVCVCVLYVRYVRLCKFGGRGEHKR